MKRLTRQFVKYFAWIAVLVSVVVMDFVLNQLSVAEKHTAKELVGHVAQQTHQKLTEFFDPVSMLMLATRDQCMVWPYFTTGPRKCNDFFIPIVQRFSQITSLGIADSRGFEMDVIPDTVEHQWLNRTIRMTGSSPEVVEWSLWQRTDSLVLLRQWQEAFLQDPRTRPWYRGAMSRAEGKLFWTDPYVFNTTNEPGITVSTHWRGRGDDTLTHVLAFDLTLENITDFVNTLKPTEHGEVLVLSGNGKQVLGLQTRPRASPSQRVDSSGTTWQLQRPELLHVLQGAESKEPFAYETGGEKWWGFVQPFALSPTQSLLIVIAIPEKDFLSEVITMRRSVIGGFAVILLLASLLLYGNHRQREVLHLLTRKNWLIREQKEQIEEARREITASITYARRIQRAILPPDHQVRSCLGDAFVLYEPKDIVAGDFYWIERTKGLLVFAVADCTGHGVPGALVSVVCHNALNRAIREFGLTDAAAILNRTRTLVIQEFDESDEEVLDGMDISLCSFDEHTLELSWAGANSPLWIGRGNEIIEVKGDKQPIGNYTKPAPFTSHTFRLKEGDVLYLMSDGYQDQFGGEGGKKFKAGQLKNLLLSIMHEPMDRQLQLLKETLEAWKGNLEQVDDVCLMGVRVRRGGESSHRIPNRPLP